MSSPQTNHSIEDRFRQLASLLNNNGTCHHKLGRHDEAHKLYVEALTTHVHAKKAESGGFDPSGDLQGRFDQAIRSAITLQKEAAVQGTSGEYKTYYLDLFHTTDDPALLGVQQRRTIFVEPRMSPLFVKDANGSVLTLHNMGLLHLERNKLSMAMNLFQMVIDIGSDPLSQAMALNCMAQVQMSKALPSDAMQFLRKALHLEQTFIKSLEYEALHTFFSAEVDKCVTKTLALIGQIKYLNGNLKKARYFCIQALQLLLERHDKKSFEVAILQYNVGLTFRAEGRFSEALRYMTPFLLKASANNLIDHPPEWMPQFALAYFTCGSIHLHMDSTSTAIEYLTHSLTMSKVLHGPKHFLVAETITHLGLAYFACGKFDDALHMFQEVYQILLPGQYLAAVCCHIGHLFYYALGDLNQALVYYKEALHNVRNDFDTQPECIVEILSTIGRVLLDQGSFHDAEVYMCEAREIYEQLQTSRRMDGKYLLSPEMIREFQGFHPTAPAA